jgi:uncharacterized protein
VAAAVATGGCSGLNRDSDPQRSGYVADEAQILADAEEAELTIALQRLERQTMHQMIVVTVPSLRGKAIETYSLNRARRMGIGRKGYDDGVMLLVAPNERKTRIEVGYGLESALTNEEAKAIILKDMIPAFSKSAYFAGIMAGTKAIITEVSAPVRQDR